MRVTCVIYAGDSGALLVMRCKCWHGLYFLRVAKKWFFLWDSGCFCDTWLYTGEIAETVKSGIDFALG